MSIKEVDFGKGGGLIPVVIQDSETRAVLMVAFANRDSVEETLKTGHGHYWSRTKGRMWMKGETSGNVQKVVDILVDCDMDTLIYVVEQTGPTCHTGERSCFHRRLSEFKRKNWVHA